MLLKIYLNLKYESDLLKKILITGISGFIGKNLIDNLVSEYKIIGLSKNGKKSKLNHIIKDINKVTAKDYTTRYPNKFKDQKDYTDKYNAQGGNLLKYGREPNKKGYDARYDYGGKGDLSAPEYHKPYKKMATTMMRQMDHELKSSNPKSGVKELVKRWRGKSEQDDPRYYDEFFKAYNQQNQK